jgi:nanoRNase/pAp phosphatase (c-di-AMP/oligoRNAs hydrolase)
MGPGANGALAERLSGNAVDLFLAQSDDPDTLAEVLETARRWAPKVPTLVLTSLPIPQPHQFNVHAVSLPDLLESNLRWHIRLAQTMRRYAEIREHFEDAESVLILLQDDPDPDAIGSGLALRQVLGRNKQTAPLGSFGRVTRPENLAMAKVLEIEIEKVSESRLKDFARVAVVDLQPPHLAKPPERIDLVIDHHPEQFNYKCPIKDIRPGYGATSSILLEYLICSGAGIGERVATAMLYGIKTDTFLLTRDVHEWDVAAFSFLYPLANQNQMRRIEHPELPPAALDALSHALKTRHVIDKVAFVPLGRVERDDLIPQMADFCLAFEGVEWAVVSGFFDGNFIVSVRNVGYVRAAGRVVKSAFKGIGSAGGHASMAKAVLPLSELSAAWSLDPRSLRKVGQRAEVEFLRALHEVK